MRISCIFSSVSATCNTSHFVSLGPRVEQNGLYKTNEDKQPLYRKFFQFLHYHDTGFDTHILFIISLLYGKWSSIMSKWQFYICL